MNTEPETTKTFKGPNGERVEFEELEDGWHIVAYTGETRKVAKRVFARVFASREEAERVLIANSTPVRRS